MPVKYLLCALLLVPWLAFSSDVEFVKSATQFLASDELKGRKAGTIGGQKAAQFIESQFRNIGLVALPSGEYQQRFKLANGNTYDANVIGVIYARKATDKSVLVTAHYDGLGLDLTSKHGDQIRNGALDNAVGVAAMMALAKRFKEYEAPSINILFIATGAEEVGLQGMHHYIANPVFPIDNIKAVVNIDGFNVTGPRLDYFVMPRKPTAFLSNVQDVAQRLGWRYQSPGWEDQMDDKFDTAPFIALGIPAVTIWTGDTLLSGKLAPRPQLGAIHSVDDEINEHWDWQGIDDHLELYEVVIKAVQD